MITGSGSRAFLKLSKSVGRCQRRNYVKAFVSFHISVQQFDGQDMHQFGYWLRDLFQRLYVNAKS